MKLKLSESNVTIERRYKLDEPVICMSPSGNRCRATEFVTRTRTYAYGLTEIEHTVYGRKARADGSIDERTGHGNEFSLSAEDTERFLTALSNAADEY